MTTLVLAEGSVFAGRYRVMRSIARGGMGAVYEVLHIETERRRALKVMLPHLVASDELRKRFRQESRVAAKVESAFIVDVFDAGVDDETKMPFLVMELLRGEEIGKRLSRVGRFSFAEVVGFLWQTALALDKTHRANIVHRDLKPENLFLAEQDDGPPRIKMLDFGIAKLVAEQGTEANVTQSIGTPLYMAPEQFLPGGRVSSATDMFSLGMMAFTLIVGSPYWREEKEKQGNVYSFIAAVMFGPAEMATARAARLGVALPVAFDVWFACATNKEPKNRFGAATEAILALAEALGVEVPAVGLLGQTAVLLDEGAPMVAPAKADDEVATARFQGTAAAFVESNAPVTELGLSSSHRGIPHSEVTAGGSSRTKRGPSRLPVIAGVLFAFLVVALVVVVASNRTPALGVARISAAASLVTVLPVVSGSPELFVLPDVVQDVTNPPETLASALAPETSASASAPEASATATPTAKPRTVALPAPAPAPARVALPKTVPTWGD